MLQLIKRKLPRFIGLVKGDWFFVDEDELLSVEEMTRILKVGRATVQRWCHNRELPAVKIGKSYRVRRDDLDEWYERKLAERDSAIALR